MTLKDFFKQPAIRLPIEQKSGSTFRETLFARLDGCAKIIGELDLSGIDTTIAVLPGKELSHAQSLVTALKETIDFYLSGQPFYAYEKLKQSLDASSIFSSLKGVSYPVQSNFFRLREHASNFALTKGELFHIPFHLRSLVATQRYSIPGFPCLYLSDSVYVAWEELRRPSLNKIQAVMMVNNREISYLDLSTDVYLGDEEILNGKTDHDLWNYLLVWPVIAACSVKVKDRTAPFKPEYIIPQLLLQMVRKEGSLDAIRFSSTHVKRSQHLKGTFHNLAIPVQDDCDDGYCSSMKSMFRMTDPVSWEIADTFSKSYQVHLYNKEEEIEMAVEQIMLYEGRSIKYDKSTFGNLEAALRQMPLADLE